MITPRRAVNDDLRTPPGGNQNRLLLLIIGDKTRVNWIRNVTSPRCSGDVWMVVVNYLIVEPNIDGAVRVCICMCVCVYVCVCMCVCVYVASE